MSFIPFPVLPGRQYRLFCGAPILHANSLSAFLLWMCTPYVRSCLSDACVPPVYFRLRLVHALDVLPLQAVFVFLPLLVWVLAGRASKPQGADWSDHEEERACCIHAPSNDQSAAATCPRGRLDNSTCSTKNSFGVGTTVFIMHCAGTAFDNCNTGSGLVDDSWMLCT